MQIHVSGYGEKDFALDLICAAVTFNTHADTYDEALRRGVENVKAYVEEVTRATDFTVEDFKTRTYSIREQFHINKLTPTSETDLDKNLQKRVSDGFFFSQYGYFEFDYDKMRLAKLLVASARIPGAPRLHIEFALKDKREKQRMILPDALEDARLKAEAIASAAGKTLCELVRVDIDRVITGGMEFGVEKRAFRGAMEGDVQQEIQNIDETFRPDDITLSKTIDCIWETMD